MAPTPSLEALLKDLTESLNATAEAISKVEQTIDPPEHGISLLNTKNEILLSYLHHLVFLVLLKLRRSKAKAQDQTDAADAEAALEAPIVRKLCELRLYLEKGVRPLEDKLKFQIEKALRAADDLENSGRRNNITTTQTTGANADSDAESDSDDADSENESVADSIASLDAAASDPAAKHKTKAGNKVHADATYARPMLASLLQRPTDKSTIAAAAAAAAVAAESKAKAKRRSSKKGQTNDSTDPDQITSTNAVDLSTLPYRPPKNRAVLMPSERAERRAARNSSRTGTGAGYRSRAIDEYLSEATGRPAEQFSVGSNIVAGGRGGLLSAEQRAADEERRAYEETHLVRLAPPSRRERRAKAATEERRGAARAGSTHMVFGGEEWRDLDRGAARIDALTRKDRSAGGGASAMLEKSRKRGRDTVDAPRASGHKDGSSMEIGERFRKKLRVVEAGRRDRGKKAVGRKSSVNFKMKG